MASKICSGVAPARIASMMVRSRPSCGVLIASSNGSRSVDGDPAQENRASGFSSERSAFCSASV